MGAGIRAAFAAGCEKLYLGAELAPVYDPETDEWVDETEEQSGAVAFWKAMKFRSNVLKEIADMDELTKALFTRLRMVSLNLDGKSRVPMVRVCMPELGDVKYYQENAKPKMVKH